MTAAKPEPLLFPKGVRFPRRNEFPPGNEDAIARIASANITTGFTRRDKGETFSSYFEVNVHAPLVFKVFCDLAVSILPDVAAPIIGLKEGEPVFGPYTEKWAAISVFEPHEELLINDGFLEFGIIFAHEGKIEEIFVKSSKYLQIWTSQPDLVLRVLEKHSIHSVPNLEFIDNYPMVSLSLGKDGNAGWPFVFNAIKDEFERLPTIEPPSTT